MKSLYAIRLEDAMSWHDIENAVAGIAERSGFNVRPNPGGWNNWQVFATKNDLTDLASQLVQ